MSIPFVFWPLTKEAAARHLAVIAAARTKTAAPGPELTNSMLRNGLIGAGVGGVAGLGTGLLRGHRLLEHALAGAALGGGLGAGYGAYSHMTTPPPPPGRGGVSRPHGGIEMSADQAYRQRRHREDDSYYYTPIKDPQIELDNRRALDQEILSHSLSRQLHEYERANSPVPSADAAIDAIKHRDETQNNYLLRQKLLKKQDGQ
jgi:hypothetical protein